MFVDLIVPYVIMRQRKKEKLNIKAITMIEPVTGWLEIMQYDDNRAISIMKLFETE